MEYKGITNEALITDVDEKKGIVTGYLASFGSIDMGNDVFVKGAFSKTIAENGPSGTKRIKYLLDHDPKQAVGVFTELKEDNKGLYYEAKIGTHGKGADYMKMVESGIINQHSVGFKRIKQEVKSDAKYIKEVFMGEGSGLQFWAANPNTPILSLKELQDLSDNFDTLNLALKSGSFTDECFEMLEEKAGILNETILSLKAANLSTLNEPIKSTNIFDLLIN